MYIFFSDHNGVLLVLICWSSSKFILARKELFAWERFGLHVIGTRRGEGGWPAHDSFDTIARYPFTVFPVCFQTLAIYSVWLFSLQIKIEHGLLGRLQD